MGESLRRLLDIRDIHALLPHITYRPGWTFTCYQHPSEGVWLRIVAPVQNSYRDEPLDLGIDSPVPPVASTDEFLRWLSWRVQRIESHESREWLRFNNRLVDDPHKEAS